MSMRNSSDTIGNRTRDLPACSTVPQPADKTIRFVLFCENVTFLEDSDVCELSGIS
jgi:hypothetical protein